MHKDMDALHELQQIDSALAELQAELAALDDGSELRTRLVEAEAELARRQDAHHTDHATQQKKEAELEKVEAKRKQLMDKAYGGVISNPKELQTLEQEIESLTRTIGRLEGELLELFDVVDGEDTAIAQQQEHVAALRAQHEETVEVFGRERERISQEIAQLEQEREQALRSIDPESVRKYEHIRERTGNLAVSVIEDQTCGACRVGLPVVLVRRVVEGSQLEQCENCLRLLWVSRGK